MGEKAIRVEGLGKEYQIGLRERGHTTFREAIARAVTAPFRRLRELSGATAEQESRFWALKDVSFDVEPGEVVGIIGRNGAGKSTLLKILSQITEPTTGKITLNGRVGSLLEVGTGFHPELTGRENIYLNGAILGMSRVEIKRKFDEIVIFAEVEKFLDTPVKRYSSGMHTRLAFSVAAHLEPEILIVDEVLAVGDVAFQKKCLGKMGEVAKGGRTVLFVSHNMTMINRLCTQAVLLSAGTVATAGATSGVVAQYLTEYRVGTYFERPKNSKSTFTLVSGELFADDIGKGRARFDLEIEAEADGWVSLDVRLTDGTGNPVGFSSLGAFAEMDRIQVKCGRNRISVGLDVSRLAVGEYLVSFDLTHPEVFFHDRVENCFAFEVLRPPVSKRSRVLPQSWGYGCYEFDVCRLDTHN